VRSRGGQPEWYHPGIQKKTPNFKFKPAGSVPRGGPPRVEFASTRWWPCAVPVATQPGMRRRGDGHQLAGSIMSASLGSESGGGPKMPGDSSDWTRNVQSARSHARRTAGGPTGGYYPY
jgi:hypothetical protein